MEDQTWSEMDAVVFKKKAKRNGPGRKRVRNDGSSEADNTEEVDQTLQSIEELLEDQKLRAQLLRSEQLASSKAQSTTRAATAGKEAPASAEAQYGLHDPKKDGSAGQKLLNLLDGQFTGQSGVTQKDQYEELASKYIEERLQKRAKQESDDTPSAPQVISTEDQIYEELRSKVAGPAVSEESSNGGVIIWNTGIAEVELPSSYAEKTLRETQLALERDEASAQNKTISSALPANFSTDFNRHRTDYVAEMKAMSKDDQRERGFVTAKRDKPTDNLAVSRFRKMESRRRHN